MKKYDYLLKDYPEYITKEQFYQVCHISKKTAKRLLDSGVIPCINSGKKTRKYKIAVKDVVHYLQMRGPKFKKWKKKASASSKSNASTLPVMPLGYEGTLLSFYEEVLSDHPDVLTVKECARMTGFSKDQILKWVRAGKIEAFLIQSTYHIPKITFLKWIAMSIEINQ